MTLLQRIKLAILESKQHHDAWQQMLSVLDTDHILRWTEEIKAWEKDPETKLNPFYSWTKGLSFIQLGCQNNPNYQWCIYATDLTQADVCLQLMQQDALELQQSDHVKPQSEIGPSTLISMGLELEESM